MYMHMAWVCGIRVVHITSFVISRLHGLMLCVGELVGLMCVSDGSVMGVVVILHQA